METRVKITYLDIYATNKVMAKIVNIWGWSDIQNKLSQFGISDSQVLKIERVLSASDENTEVF